MTIHLTARLAWHLDGWNGCVCRQPAANTYCVGKNSYPGEHIAEKRNISWETSVAGQSGGRLEQTPPCCFSYNAFGLEHVLAASAPPHWFNQEAQTCRWRMAPATIATWPYEEMYGDEVISSKGYDYEKRLAKAQKYFQKIEPDRSLIFYYANYSNPFSEDEAKRYVLIGLSRVKDIGPQLLFEGCSEDIKKRYAGGFVWQRDITSHYPDQGLRLPYHVYQQQPDMLSRFVLFPENPRLCKYATRQFEDDEALGMVERFLNAAQTLQEMGDSSADWNRQANWLQGLIAELWQHRGVFPGLPNVLELLKFTEAIAFFKERALAGCEREAFEALFSMIEGKVDTIPGLPLKDTTIAGFRKQWQLKTLEEQRFLREILPRFSLRTEQLQKLLSDKRTENGIISSLPDIADNPYILAEQYQGGDLDDSIPWSNIDRGMIPSPALGEAPLAAVDDGRRLRALLVDTLKRDEPHIFSPADLIINSVNRRLAALPEWKRAVFHERYLSVEAELIAEAIKMHRAADRLYLYLREAFTDERLIEEKLRFLIGGPDITLRTPVIEEHWRGFLYDPNSPLAEKAPTEYASAIAKQIAACQRVFLRPVSVLAGEAGTGKTTVIRALIKAVKRAQGVGSAVMTLAPTGKAADKIREVIEKDTSLSGSVEVATLHSFLAKRGWLNPNLTFKRTGGQQEEGFATYILDEASMLDLALTASFFRAVKWPTVQRLIFVGDPNQLPPIGRGRVFADLIDYMSMHAPESMATLEHNLRQLLGRVQGNATGIIDLAQCYLQKNLEEVKTEEGSLHAEQMLRQVQLGGEVAPDLRVLYWQDQEELNRLLLEQMVKDLAADHCCPVN